MMTPDRRTAFLFLQLNRGELNGFLTQVTNNLANIVILPPIVLLAYRVGLAAAFIGGLIEMSGALILYEEKNENSSENGKNLISMGFRRGDSPGCP